MTVDRSVTRETSVPQTLTVLSSINPGLTSKLMVREHSPFSLQRYGIRYNKRLEARQL